MPKFAPARSRHGQLRSQNSMPYQHRISKEEGIAYVESTRPVDLASTVEELVAIVDDPDFAPHYNILADARDLDYRFSVSDVRALAKAIVQTLRSYRGRIAFLVNDGSAMKHASLATVFAEIAGFPAIMPFLTEDEAKQWLKEDAQA